LNDSAVDEQLAERYRDSSGRTTGRLRSTSGRLSEDRRIIVGDLSVRRLARAHDYDNDYDSDSELVDDGIDLPYLEEELLVKYKVEYVRTPVNETCVLQDVEYKGVHRVQNLKFRYGYRAHIWRVNFVVVDGKEHDEPVPGLLQITVKRWRSAGLVDPRYTLGGVVTIRADKKRRIKWVKTRPGAVL